MKAQPRRITWSNGLPTAKEHKGRRRLSHHALDVERERRRLVFAAIAFGIVASIAALYMGESLSQLPAVYVALGTLVAAAAQGPSRAQSQPRRRAR
jgi:hypothetical protein